MHAEDFYHGLLTGVKGIAFMLTSLGLYDILDAICLDNWTTLKFALKHEFCGIIFAYGITKLVESLSLPYSYFTSENAERSPADAPGYFPDESVEEAYDDFEYGNTFDF
ncbi:hypothetical protein TNCV_910231 [Trichonephila clavipes]|uniref:Uncharacterized protein n=1 Tax=Trichonephila clavipes TaxID=2585209 RepID=A0A8X7BEK2_TRICX|nr:hypothetical protein TNCV_910231 [Trichonephila clavipes]